PGVRFLYTDISSSFTRHGAEIFGNQYPWAVFKRLDIEKDVVAQGYMHSTFDIVYASNVLHDTEYILKTLSQVKSLLKPGGMLALNEFTVMKDLLLFSGGLLHGWWLFKDPEMRLEHSCLLGVEQWRKATKLAGFEEFVAYMLPFIKQDQGVRQAVMACLLAASESVTETVSKVGAADSLNSSSSGALAAPLQRKPSDRIANTAIYERVNECLLRIVGEGRIEQFSADVPFMEAGLGSIEMLEFSKGLERRFFIQLERAFLFQSNTISKVGRAIEEITVNSSLRVEGPRLKTAAVSHVVSNDDYPVTEPSGKTDSSARRTGLKDIAVIGMALRFPGNCETAEDFY